METQKIRRLFLQYFKEQGHAIIPSSPVVPHDDPSLLFTNAGMNQFKDVFLGSSIRDYTRAVTSQKCVRVGGKHNDLDNVGHTSRHLTFFEMLGNFSFGDYFKQEAIRFAWEASTNVFGLDPERIWPTVFREDDEAFEMWTKYVKPEKITRFDEKNNFWAMGDVGPCGPCSELLYDRGPKYGDAKKPSEDLSEERYLEFWNLVFMQYNRMENGEMTPLPKPSIDTGAGLERIVSLKMNVESLFETDLFHSLIAEVEAVSGVRYDPEDHTRGPAFRVIADHLRCLAFAIADGAQPSNVERGYVLRKVLRRAVRYGKSLGFEEPFLAKILPRLTKEMSSDYRELAAAETRIAEILTSEEEAFLKTLRRGGNILGQIIEHARYHGGRITGEDAFKLKDTYGLPIEEILLLAKDNDLVVDMERFQYLEEEAKERSRRVHKGARQVAGENLFESFVKTAGTTEFLGYVQHDAIGKVQAIVCNGEFADELHEGQEGLIVLDRTPFYAEMGGQVGDTGTLSGENALVHVENCTAPYKGVIGHVGKVEKGTIQAGMNIKAEIDHRRRQRIENNHTATHLLHWALHQVLGKHVQQAGSVVEPGRLRFDFNHHKAVSKEEIRQIEDLINTKIRENRPVNWYEISYLEAQKRPEIKQFFGDKYDSEVRVINIDEYSQELCGGTHTSLLGNIGLFRIMKEGSIAAGVRRIEAVTGPEAEALARNSEGTLEKAAEKLKTPSPKLLERLDKLLEENRTLQQEMKALKKAGLEKTIEGLAHKIQEVNEVPLLAAEVELTSDEIRHCADRLMEKFPSLVLILASQQEGKCQILARVTEDLIGKGIKANEVIRALAPIIEGSGGGKPNSAQAGGKAPQRIQEALAKAQDLL